MVGTFLSSVLSILFLLCLFCFLPCQLQLVADNQEDFSVCIAAHGIERVVAACLALEHRQMRFKSALQIRQHLFTLGSAKERQ